MISVTAYKVTYIVTFVFSAVVLLVFTGFSNVYTNKEQAQQQSVNIITRLENLELKIKEVYSNLAVRDSVGTRLFLNTENSDDLYQVPSNHVTRLASQTRCTKRYKVLILITTHITHFYQRQNIRSTYGKGRSVNSTLWTTVFTVGRSYDKGYTEKIRKEKVKYQDIILGDIYEDFFHLTFKIQMGFEWAVKYCNFEFLLKGDDDVFVNMPLLFSYLANPETPQKELYAGNVYYGAPVSRGGRYSVGLDEYKKDIYPRYCSGGGFILSRDVIQAMIPKFNLINPLKIDDVYVGILALKAGIDTTFEKNFEMFGSSKKCKYNNVTIVHHPIKTFTCMEKLFNNSMSSHTSILKYQSGWNDTISLNNTTI